MGTYIRVNTFIVDNGAFHPVNNLLFQFRSVPQIITCFPLELYNWVLDDAIWVSLNTQWFMCIYLHALYILFESKEGLWPYSKGCHYFCNWHLWSTQGSTTFISARIYYNEVNIPHMLQQFDPLTKDLWLEYNSTQTIQ